MQTKTASVAFIPTPSSFYEPRYDPLGVGSSHPTNTQSSNRFCSVRRAALLSRRAKTVSIRPIEIIVTSIMAPSSSAQIGGHPIGSKPYFSAVSFSARKAIKSNMRGKSGTKMDNKTMSVVFINSPYNEPFRFTRRWLISSCDIERIKKNFFPLWLNCSRFVRFMYLYSAHEPMTNRPCLLASLSYDHRKDKKHGSASCKNLSSSFKPKCSLAEGTLMHHP